MVCNRIVACIKYQGEMTDVDIWVTDSFPMRISDEGQIRTPPSCPFWFNLWNTVDLYNNSLFVIRISQAEAIAINEHFNIMGYI